MRVLFLMIAYPDVKKDTNMYTDLTHEFLRNGHDVYVAAPDNKITQICNEEGIKVLRIRTLPLFNTSLFRKGIANLLLPFQYKIAINRHFKDSIFELIITPTPPITFLGIARFLKNKYNAKLYLILRDIFPQNAKDLGLIKNSLVFSYFRHQEKKLYMIADKIGCMSQKNIDFVLKHNPELSLNKLHLLPNWTNIYETVHTEFNNVIEGIIKNKFIVVFGGNFGIPQKLEFLIDVADKIRENKEIIFLLIGGGTEKNRIKKLVRDRNLENVLILDQLPRREYIGLLKQCDVGLVTLSDKFTIPNIPSRTLSYWSLKLPVLAAVDNFTDYNELLEKSNGGLWSLSGNIEAFVTNLMTFYNNSELKVKMGQNGYNYLIQELNSEAAYKTIMSAI